MLWESLTMLGRLHKQAIWQAVQAGRMQGGNLIQVGKARQDALHKISGEYARSSPT